MTTVMLVAAMVPIALGQGPGAGARASMAKVIIGGQMLSLVLALLVTPVFYEILDMFVNFARRLGIRFTVEPTPRLVNQPHVHGHPNGDGIAIEPERETAASFA
jgi:HAE1 family hydrophobic/amphiphilic exporter-1